MQGRSEGQKGRARPPGPASAAPFKRDAGGRVKRGVWAAPIQRRMKLIFGRLRTLFLLLFFLLTAVAWGYQYFYVAPKQRCEAARNWWDAGTRTCGHVVFIPDLTGKPLPPGVHAHRPV